MPELPLETRSIRIEAELFDALTLSSGLAADIAASESFQKNDTISVQVSEGVKAAFAHAVGLGLITVHPTDTWPQLRKLIWKREDVIT